MSYYEGVIFKLPRYTFETACTSKAPELETQDMKLEPPELGMWMNVVVRDLGGMKLVFAGEVDCVQGAIVQWLFVLLPQTIFTKVDMPIRKIASSSSRQGEVWLKT